MKSPVNNSYPIVMRIIILLAAVFSTIVVAAQEQGLTAFQQNDKWGYADYQGHTVIEAKFSVAHAFSGGLALVKLGGVPVTDPVVKSFVKVGYIDQKGDWIIQSRFKYDFFYDFSEGLVPFRQLAKGWGYMDTKGKIVIRPHFQWAGSFANGIAPVLRDDRCAHIDRSGEIVYQGQVVPRNKTVQAHNGTFLDRPQAPPCS